MALVRSSRVTAGDWRKDASKLPGVELDEAIGFILASHLLHGKRDAAKRQVLHSREFVNLA